MIPMPNCSCVSSGIFFAHSQPQRLLVGAGGTNFKNIMGEQLKYYCSYVESTRGAIKRAIENWQASN
jgi:hypothetical protein